MSLFNIQNGKKGRLWGSLSLSLLDLVMIIGLPLVRWALSRPELDVACKWLLFLQCLRREEKKERMLSRRL